MSQPPLTGRDEASGAMTQEQIDQFVDRGKIRFSGTFTMSDDEVREIAQGLGLERLVINTGTRIRELADADPETTYLATDADISKGKYALLVGTVYTSGFFHSFAVMCAVDTNVPYAAVVPELRRIARDGARYVVAQLFGWPVTEEILCDEQEFEVYADEENKADALTIRRMRRL